MHAISLLIHASKSALRRDFLRSACRGLMIALGCACGVTAAAGQTGIAIPGLTNVGQTAAPVSVTVKVTSAGTAVSPSAVTQGVTGQDFAVAAGGSCAAGTAYSTGATCTVMVSFSPKAPGYRSGAVILTGTDGSVLGTTLVTAQGKGALATLLPGRIDTVVGSGAWTYRGDGVAATEAQIFLPMAVAVDAAGDIFLSDSNNNRIRRVDGTTNLISTIAGNGTPAFTGDGGLATAASISNPAGLIVDGAGNVYFVDSSNHAVRRVDAVTGMIRTVAGQGGVPGYTGDGGLATAATLYLPEGLAMDTTGNLYIADTGNNAVRVVDAATGKIRTVAGTGALGFNGDGILAVAARLSSPWSVMVAPDGSLYISDLQNNRVRRVDASGLITTIVGTGVLGFAGDGGLASLALLHSPAALAMDPAGNLYVADVANNRVRKVSATTGIITTVTGDGSETFKGDAGPSNKASLYGPYALYYNGTGDLYVADMFHNRIRKMSAATVPLTYDQIRVSKTSPPQPVTVENDGNDSLTLQAPVFAGAALDAATTTCVTGTLMATEATCVLGVEFAPTTIGDMVQGMLTIPDNAANTPLIVTVAGPVLSVEPTSVTLTSNHNPSLQGDSITFTAAVTSADPNRSGPVTFNDGATPICTAVPISSAGIAVCTTSSLTLGQHALTAFYAGDPNNAANTSNVVTQLVQQPVTVTLGLAPLTTVVTGTVLMSATVAAVTGTPTGTVTFYDGSTAIGSAALSGGVATLSIATLTAGTHPITAQYTGDTKDATATSNVVNELITLGSTTVIVASSNTNTSFGLPVILTATVLSANGLQLTGTVQFMDGTTVLASASLNLLGVAVTTLSNIPPGVHNIVAVYQGDAQSGTAKSAPLIETIQKIATTALLSSGMNPAVAGASVQLTAKVSVVASAIANGAVTGTVTFSLGTTVLGTAPVNGSGLATLTLTTLPVGANQITASYGGDTSYLTSVSTALLETVTQATATVTLGGPATVDVGTTATFTAVLAATGPTPNGTMTLRDGSAVVTVQPGKNAGTYTFATAGLALGSHTLAVSFSDDPNYVLANSNLLVVVVQQGASVTALTSSANPQIVGQNVTLTATVTSTSPSVTGTVSFKDGSTVLGTTAVGAGGVATLTLSTLTAGAHPLVAVYSGDTNHTASSSAGLSENIVQAVTIALASSANPANGGAAVTFTAKLPGGNGLLPSGAISFVDGTVVMGAGTIDGSGTASFTTSALAVGTHSIVAVYVGDANFAAAKSVVLLQTVQSATTQMVLTASANPAIYGTPLTFRAAITSNGGTATGTVTFTDGTTALGTGTLDATGVATLTTSTLTPGPHSITAVYGGDMETAASTSVPLAISVKQLTTLTVSSSGNPAQTLASVTLTAVVKNSGVGVATGAVTFTDGATVLGSATLDATGVATLTVPSLVSGSHSIAVAYSGDSGNFAVSATFVQGVQLRPTSTVLTATTTGPTNSQQVTLISVVRFTGTVTPTGTITFTSGSTVVGTVTLDATGVATLTIYLTGGGQNIIASYNGDSSYGASASLATGVSGGPATQFTMTAAPPTMSMQSKQHGSVTITVASVKDFADTLEFGCLGLPFAATCTFSQTQMKLEANGTHTVTLTVDTGNPLGAGATAKNEQQTGSPVYLAFLPGVLVAGIALFRRKRNLPILSVVALMLGLGAMMSATGCAGLAVNGTPAGTYTFKVAATGMGTGASQTQTMTLTVTQ